jgi:hypothetical protein
VVRPGVWEKKEENQEMHLSEEEESPRRKTKRSASAL